MNQPLKPEYRKLLDAMPLGVTVSARDIINAGGAVSGPVVGYMLRRLPDYVRVTGNRAHGTARYTKFRNPPPQPTAREDVRIVMSPILGGTVGTGIRYVPVSLPKEPWSVTA